MNASFTYDGDGARAVAMENGQTTIFVGSHYEKTGAQITKYYFAGSARIAARKYILPQAMSLEYLLGDHLGSTSLTTDANGAKISEMRYKPFGELRYTAPTYALTRYTFCEAPLAGTGQYSYMDAPTTIASEGFGLMFYNARWYDPVTGRFAQADSIVPAGAQGWDRYAYVNNNPLRFTDPSGHMASECGEDKSECNGTSQTEFVRNERNAAILLAQNYALQCQAGKSAYCVTGYTPSDGWKKSVTVSAGWGSNLNANETKIPTLLYYGVSLVTDNDGGIQLFLETLDIEFNPTLQLNPAEQANPSELFGIGVSATQGPIWKTDGTVFVTNNYEGESHLVGGSWDIFTADVYESFPNPNVKGLDIGVSGGSPSLWSISTQAHPLFDMPRFDITFWQYP